MSAQIEIARGLEDLKSQLNNRLDAIEQVILDLTAQLKASEDEEESGKRLVEAAVNILRGRPYLVSLARVVRSVAGSRRREPGT